MTEHSSAHNTCTSNKNNPHFTESLDNAKARGKNKISAVIRTWIFLEIHGPENVYFCKRRHSGTNLPQALLSLRRTLRPLNTNPAVALRSFCFQSLAWGEIGCIIVSIPFLHHMIKPEPINVSFFFLNQCFLSTGQQLLVQTWTHDPQTGQLGAAGVNSTSVQTIKAANIVFLNWKLEDRLISHLVALRTESLHTKPAQWRGREMKKKKKISVTLIGQPNPAIPEARTTHRLFNPVRQSNQSERRFLSLTSARVLVDTPFGSEWIPGQLSDLLLNSVTTSYWMFTGCRA